MSYHAGVPTPTTDSRSVATRPQGPADRPTRSAGRLGAADRRARIAQHLADGSCIPGDALAHDLGVSRQVIVQDIAVLRAGGLDIVATVRGYLLASSADVASARRVIGVRHGPDDAVTELTALVDTGARVVDVIVAHPVYGSFARSSTCALVAMSTCGNSVGR